MVEAKDCHMDDTGSIFAETCMIVARCCTYDQEVAASNSGRSTSAVAMLCNLVLAKGRWCSAALTMTTCVAESNGSLLLGL